LATIGDFQSNAEGIVISHIVFSRQRVALIDSTFGSVPSGRLGVPAVEFEAIDEPSHARH